jgi:hypothetical protein
VQIALQLAWYKTHGSFAATVKTARTEPIRTPSEDSRTWVLSMTMRSPPGLPLLIIPTCSDHYQDCDDAQAPPLYSYYLSWRMRRRPAMALIDIFLGLRLMVRPETGRTSCVVDEPLFEGRSALLVRLRWFGILRRRCTSAISCGRTLP